MIQVIPKKLLGRLETDWLQSRFHFFFAGVEAPMGHGFGPLRVWNDDLIQPRTGFDMHPHRDMEIITYVRRGAISHEDSLGNKGRTAAGDVQVMHAGTGITHSEHNREDEATELFQIWVEPDAAGHEPGWQEAEFPKADRAGSLVPLASGQPEFANQALPIHQDATFYGAVLGRRQSVAHPLGPDRIAYLVAPVGHVTINGAPVEPRDGVAMFDLDEIEIAAVTDAEVVLFDLPGPPRQP